MNSEEKSRMLKKPVIYVVIGTRAQLVKMAPLMNLMQKENLDYYFIYTSQHKESISKILDDFKVKKPDRVIFASSEANTLTKFVGWGGVILLKSLMPRKIFPKKGIVLTHGDTVTTVWAAIVGKLAGCKIAHVEAGLRTFNLFHPFPEELLRVITSNLSDIHFCQNDWAINNLKRYKGEKINTLMNTLFDSVKIAFQSDVKVDIPNEPYCVISIHRFQTIYTKNLEKTVIPLLEKVAQSGIKLIFVLHPSTREVLKKKNSRLYKRLENNEKIVLKERYPYFEFMKLLKQSEFVITDGGSNQEELSYMGKPTLLFRKNTSRIEGIDKNVLLSSFDPTITMNFVQNYKDWKSSPIDSNISPCEKIVNYLKEL